MKRKHEADYQAVMSWFSHSTLNGLTHEGESVHNSWFNSAEQHELSTRTETLNNNMSLMNSECLLLLQSSCNAAQMFLWLLNPHLSQIIWKFSNYHRKTPSFPSKVEFLCVNVTQKIPQSRPPQSLKMFSAPEETSLCWNFLPGAAAAARTRGAAFTHRNAEASLSHKCEISFSPQAERRKTESVTCWRRLNQILSISEISAQCLYIQTRDLISYWRFGVSVKPHGAAGLRTDGSSSPRLELHVVGLNLSPSGLMGIFIWS